MLDSQATDHDLLIELRTEMRSMKDAMDKLSKTIGENITDRIESLEVWRGWILGGLGTVGILMCICAWVYTSQQSIQDTRIDNLIKQVNKIP
jgi:hypothetical protein